MDIYRFFVSPLCALVIALGPSPASSQAIGTVTTLAGGLGGMAAGHADGYGTSASFNGPCSTSVDVAGTFCIVVDYNSYVLRHIVISSGLVTTLAGQAGITGSADGTGSAAVFHNPYGTALNTGGSIAIVTDQQNGVLRRVVVSSAAVTTIAGRVGVIGAADGVGSAASFNYPTGISMDAAGLTVLVTDWQGHAIRRCVLSSALVTTLAGTASVSGTADGVGSNAAFRNPVNVALDAAGVLAIVADTGNNVVRLIVVSTGAVSTLAGLAGTTGAADGTGVAARFNSPFGANVDAAGSFAIISDQGNNVLRLVNISSGVVSTFAGNGSAGITDGVGTSATLFHPQSAPLGAWGEFAVIPDAGSNLIRYVFISPPSATQTETSSVSPSLTQTISQTESPTLTVSRTQSPSRTQPRTPSQTPSQIVSPSQTSSVTFTPSQTPTQTDTTTQTLSPSTGTLEPNDYSGILGPGPCSQNLSRLYRFGAAAGDAIGAQGDDVTTASIAWTGTPFILFGAGYTSIFPSTNGFLSLGVADSNYLSVLFPSYTTPGIALWWMDLVVQSSLTYIPGYSNALPGNVYYRPASAVTAPAPEDITRMAADVASSLPNETPFTAAILEVVTYFAVSAYLCCSTYVTVQAAIAADVSGRSFVTLCFDNLPNSSYFSTSGTLAEVGFNGPSSGSYWNAPLTRTPALVNLTCGGNGGCYTFRVDNLTVVLPSPSYSSSSSPTQSGSLTPSQQNSPTPSSSRTTTQIKTPSVTQSPTQTRSASQTVSMTLSSSGTPTLSASPSQSRTLSPTGSRSPSQTGSQSQSMSTSYTRSETRTQSQSPSTTLTSSTTRTHSGSPSQSGSRSSSQTSSQSQSMSTSYTRSETRTQSQSLSASHTQSQSQTASASPSQSPSLSATQSQSGSQSSSESASQSQSLSTSYTRSETRTQSLTPSATRSGSQLDSSSATSSQSLSASVSSSQSQTFSGSPDQSHSVRETRSPSLSSSASQSESRSHSTSCSQSESATGSVGTTVVTSATSSQTSLQEQTLSSSASQLSTPPNLSTESSSQSGSASPSPSASLWEPPSRLRTPSQTPTWSPSQTQLSSLPPGVSRTSSVSLSLSSSPEPYALAVLAPSVQPLLLSDSLPAVELGFALNRCPAPVAERSIVLTCSPTAMSVNDDSLSASLRLLVSPMSGVLYCDASSAIPSSTTLPVLVSLQPAFRSPSYSTTVSCALRSAVGMGNASVGVSLKATLWPLYDDVIVIASNGFSRSVRGLGVLNTTGELLRSSPVLMSSRRLSKGGFASYSNPLSSALSNATIVLGAIEATWTRVNLSAEIDVPFSLTVITTTPVVLRSSRRAFTVGSSVSVGGVLCSDAVASADGQWLAFTAPSPALVCGAVTPGDCSYAELVVTNPPTEEELGASLMCPPYCPGFVSTGSGVFPLAVGPLSGNATRFLPAVQSAGAPTVLTIADYGAGEQSQAPSYPSGLYFAAACSATGVYTDPTTGACTNTSSPLFSLCAFGSGDSCEPCPAGGMCPGGSRCWSLPGFYTPSETSAAVLPCSYPSPQSRCVGWSAALSQTKCGSGYLQGSYLCSACAPGFFFLGSNGVCQSCPAVSSLWDRYGVLILLVASILGFTLIVFGAKAIAIQLSGGDPKMLMRRVVGFVVYLLTVIQVLSNVSQVNSELLPQLLQSVYRGIALLQLQGVAVPPSCTSGYYFSADVSLMAVGMGLWLFAVLLSLARCCSSNLRLPHLSQGIRVLTLLAVYLHPSVSSTALSLLSCQVVQLSRRAIDTIEGDFMTPPASASSEALNRVALLASNPYIECFIGPHKSAGAFAVVTVVIFVIGLPLSTFALLWQDVWLADQLKSIPSRHRSRRVSSFEQDSISSLTKPPRRRKGPHPLLAPFLDYGDYVPRAWFWRHVDMAVVLGLAALAALLPLPSSLFLLGVKMALTLALLSVLIGCISVLPNPYREPWKRHLRVAFVVLSMSCVVVNGTSRAIDLGFGGPSLLSFVTSVSYINIIVLCATVLIVLSGFLLGGATAPSDSSAESPGQAVVCHSPAASISPPLPSATVLNSVSAEVCTAPGATVLVPQTTVPTSCALPAVTDALPGSPNRLQHAGRRARAGTPVLSVATAIQPLVPLRSVPRDSRRRPRRQTAEESVSAAFDLMQNDRVPGSDSSPLSVQTNSRSLNVAHPTAGSTADTEDRAALPGHVDSYAFAEAPRQQPLAPQQPPPLPRSAAVGRIALAWAEAANAADGSRDCVGRRLRVEVVSPEAASPPVIDVRSTGGVQRMGALASPGALIRRVSELVPRSSSRAVRSRESAMASPAPPASREAAVDAVTGQSQGQPEPPLRDTPLPLLVDVRRLRRNSAAAAVATGSASPARAREQSAGAVRAAQELWKATCATPAHGSGFTISQQSRPSLVIGAHAPEVVETRGGVVATPVGRAGGNVRRPSLVARSAGVASLATMALQDKSGSYFAFHAV